MSYSYSVSESTTFTVTHARHISAKVATDLKRMQRFYGRPSDRSISEYEEEVVALLKAGYLDTVFYGYRRNGNWIEPTMKYSSRELAYGSTGDDDPGRIRPGANVEGADFHSYLTYTAAWGKLSPVEQDAFEQALPFQRTGATEPGVSGYFNSDRTYSAGGRALDRFSVRSH